MEHPYQGIAIVFATMHRKESILQPLFTEYLSATLMVPEGLDTDQYGTFSGEISRSAPVKEVLVKKARAGMKIANAKYGLASEGSFGPHPWIPFADCNQETLVFLDEVRDICLYAHHISLENRAEYAEVANNEEAEQFLNRIDFGSQAVILKPEVDWNRAEFMFKGLTQKNQVFEAVQKIKNELSHEKVWIETDNRAHLSPKRQDVIRSCGRKLIEKIMSLCPSCQTPGFEMTDHIKGLKCGLCGLKSDKAEKEIWSCPSLSCDYREVKPRLDGLTELDPGECEWCNP